MSTTQSSSKPNTRFEKFVVGSEYDPDADGYVYVFDINCTVNVDDEHEYDVVYVGETGNDLKERFDRHFTTIDNGTFPNDREYIVEIGCLGHHQTKKKRLITISPVYSLTGLRTVINLSRYNIETDSEYRNRRGMMEDRVAQSMTKNGCHVIDSNPWGKNADIPDDI